MTPRLCKNTQRGRWRVEVKWPDGARKFYQLRATLDDDPAEEYAAFVRDVLPALADARKAKPPSRQGVLLRDVAIWYLETHLPYTGREPKTVEYYSSSIYSFISYCQSRHVGRSGQLSTRLIQEWQLNQMATKGRERPSREQVLHIRRWLKVATEFGEIPELPNIQWEIPRKRKGQQHRAHPQETIDAWVAGLAAWRPYVGQVARWVAATGWRISDVMDLRYGEVDLAGRWIDREQIKTKEALPYPITDTMLAILQDALEGRTPGPGEHVFLSHRGKPWVYAQLYDVVVNYQRSRWDGDNITFRDLRKSFGTHLAMRGCPPNVLKELMGHSEIAITLSYYVQVDRDSMRKWAEGFGNG